MGHSKPPHPSVTSMVTPRFREGDLCIIGFGTPGLFGLPEAAVVLCEVKNIYDVDHRTRTAIYEVEVMFDETDALPQKLLIRDAEAVSVDDDLIEAMIAAVASKATQLRKVLKQLHRLSTGRMRSAPAHEERPSEV